MQSFIILWVRGTEVYVSDISAQFGTGINRDNPSWVNPNPDLDLRAWFSAEWLCKHKLKFTEVWTWTACRSCPGQSQPGKQLHCNDAQNDISSWLVSFIFVDIAVLHEEEQCASHNICFPACCKKSSYLLTQGKTHVTTYTWLINFDSWWETGQAAIPSKIHTCGSLYAH